MFDFRALATSSLLLLAAPTARAQVLHDAAVDRDGAAVHARRSEPIHFAPAFVENRGQWDEGSLFMARVSGLRVRVERDAIAFALPAWQEGEDRRVVRLVFEHASADACVEGQERLAGTRSYFLGQDPGHWRTDVPAWSSLRFRQLYPGIDVSLRFTDGGLEYDVEVAPYADLSAFAVRVEGADGLELEHGDALCIRTPQGTIRQRTGPTWHVLADGRRSPAVSSFRQLDEARFGLEVAARHSDLPLVIDPTLTWSTYLGGSTPVDVGDIAWANAVHEPTGDVFVVGTTEGSDFPTTPGTWQQASGVGDDVFVARLSSVDGSLVYSSVIGGGEHERALDVAVDPAGRASVVGMAESMDFPSTQGAVDEIKNSISYSGFALRLSPGGHRLLYSTFIEGVIPLSFVEPTGIATLPNGSTIVAGVTNTRLPIPPGGVDLTIVMSEGFVLQIDPTGTDIEWGTYLGGSNFDRIEALQQGSDGAITVGGYTVSADFPTTAGAWQPQWQGSTSGLRAFVTRLTGDGSSIVWSTYLGGTSSTSGDYLFDLALLPDAGVIVGGYTSSWDAFPITPGVLVPSFVFVSGVPYNGFLTRFTPDGSTLVYSTFLGACNSEGGIRGLTADGAGVVTAYGYIRPPFPTTPGSYDPNGGGKPLIARLDHRGSRVLYGTRLGAATGLQYGTDVCMTGSGRITVSGAAYGHDFPTTPGSAQPQHAGGSSDAFVATLELVHDGIRTVGASTPACRGSLQLNSSGVPSVGSTGFELWCSGAPPDAAGWMVFGSLAGQPSSLHGADLWLDGTRRLTRRAVRSDRDGFVSFVVPLPASTQGLEFGVQCLFLTSPACPGSAPLCASQALGVTPR